MVDLAKDVTGPLKGVRILDTTSVVFGAYATQILADLGADVIKVEFPGGRGTGGDIMRGAGISPDGVTGMGPVFMMINRNKRSVMLDIRQPEDAAAFRELIAQCDIFASSIRYDGLKRLGMGYDEVKAIRPDVIYAHGAGYGSEGPYAGMPAYDDIIQTASGIADLLSHTDGDPTPRLLPSLIADKVSGLFMAQAITAALYHRQSTGEGQFIEVPMLEVATSFNLVEHFFGQAFDPPTGPWTYWRVTNQDRKPHPTKDGYIGILPYRDDQWLTFFDLADLGHVIKDPRFATDEARRRNIRALYGYFDQVTRTRTTQEWLDVLRPLDIPAIPLNRMEDLMDDQHLKAVGLFERHAHPICGDYFAVRPPVKYSATPANIRRHPPALGENTEEVLAELGITRAPKPEPKG